MEQTCEQEKLLDEIGESLLRLYGQQKYLYGTADEHGSLDEILNVYYKVKWVQERLALKN